MLKMRPWHRGRRGGQQERLGHVVDIGQVAQLLAAPDLERPAFQHGADPDAEEGLPRVADAQARAVAIGQTQADHRAVGGAVLDHPVLLAGEFRHAVGVGRVDRVRFVHRQVQRAAVELAGGGVHHHRLGRRLAHRLDQPHLRHRVHRDVGQRVALAAHVAGLGGEVEDHLGAFADRPQIDLADIGAHQFDLGAVEIGRIGAAAEQEPVQRHHPRAARGQRMAQIRAQEPGPARHQHLATAPVHRSLLRLMLQCRRRFVAELGQGRSSGSSTPRRRWRRCSVSGPPLRMISEKPNSSSSSPATTSMRGQRPHQRPRRRDVAVADRRQRDHREIQRLAEAELLQVRVHQEHRAAHRHLRDPVEAGEHHHQQRIEGQERHHRHHQPVDPVPPPSRTPGRCPSAAAPRRAPPSRPGRRSAATLPAAPRPARARPCPAAAAGTTAAPMTSRPGTQRDMRGR